jgi:hypothetical protein
MAAEKSIVDDVSSGGLALPGHLLLTGDLGLTPKDAYVQLERMRAAARGIGKVLDSHMKAGTMRLDLALEASGRLRLLEISLRDPDHRDCLAAGDRTAYHAVKSALMSHAKSLAGFGPEASAHVL